MNSPLTKDQMMQPCRRGCGELVHLENDGFHVCRTSNERISPHVKWLREVASHLRAERRTSLANTCEQAADELLAVSRHRDTLLAAHEARQDETPERHVLTLHGFELHSALEFLGGEPDTEVSIAYFQAAKDVETGEEMPAGHYVWLTEYPEEGRALLSTDPPKDHDEPSQQVETPAQPFDIPARDEGETPADYRKRLALFGVHLLPEKARGEHD